MCLATKHTQLGWPPPLWPHFPPYRVRRSCHSTAHTTVPARPSQLGTKPLHVAGQQASKPPTSPHHCTGPDSSHSLARWGPGRIAVNGRSSNKAFALAIVTSCLVYLDICSPRRVAASASPNTPPDTTAGLPLPALRSTRPARPCSGSECTPQVFPTASTQSPRTLAIQTETYKFYMCIHPRTSNRVSYNCCLLPAAVSTTESFTLSLGKLSSTRSYCTS